MKENYITNSVLNIGGSDNSINLFEGQYALKNGMSYNSYLIKDKKNTVIDTIDEAVTDTWFKNLEDGLNGENIDYLIISHMEPDHAYNIGALAEKYPEMKIVGNQFTFNILCNLLLSDSVFLLCAILILHPAFLAVNNSMHIIELEPCT